MKRLTLSVCAASMCAALGLSVAGVAQEQDAIQESLLKRHQISGPVMECLADLSEDCILSASLTTVIDEAQAIERIKVLSAVALGLAEAGDMDRAVRPLGTALEELGAIRFSFVQRMKQAEIAPIYAYMGKSEDVLALTADLSSVIKGQTLEECIYMAALAGRAGDVITYVNALTLYGPRLPYILTDAAELLAVTSDPSAVVDVLLDNKTFRSRPSLMVRAAHIKGVNGTVKAGLLHDASEAMKSQYGIYQRVRYAAAKRAFQGAGNAEIIEAFLSTEKELRSMDDKRDMAIDLGRTYISIGMSDRAISQIYFFKTADEQASYLMKLSRLPKVTKNLAEGTAFTGAVDAVLYAAAELESPLERDTVRLKLLEAARRVSNLDIAKKIVNSLEDDDNAAKALALLLPLVKK